MGFWKSLAGTYTVEITSGSPMDTLDALSKQGISLMCVVYINELCVQGNVYVSQMNLLRDCITNRNEELRILHKNGVYWSAVRLLKRPVLMIGILIYAFLALFLPTRILFIQVDGNVTLPDKLIIDKAETCGVIFGASRREIRSEKIKNALLSAIPELQWAGVNTSGCVAVISVRERSVVDARDELQFVSSIVALHDGIVQEMTVTQGTALCHVGQAVKKGEVLVSGYTDCGIFIKAQQAQAEVVARTERILSCCTPAVFMERGEFEKERTRYAIKIGKNIIKLWKSSGILDTECVKMYEEKSLLLPGGLRLPISLIKQSFVFHELSLAQCEQNNDFKWMEGAAKNYLLTQMSAGSIIKSVFSATLNDDIFSLYGCYSCNEEIGQTRREEFVINNGENN